MHHDTARLIASLPYFKDLFVAADKRGSARWHVIQWKGILPNDVRPEDVEVVGEPYRNRTIALSASRKLKLFGPRTRIIDKNLPWGVWQWPDSTGIIQYQSVRPEIIVSSAQNASTPIVSGSKEAYPTTPVRLSDSAYTMLRRIADEDHKTLQAVINEALQEYDKLRFYRRLNASYQALRDDPKAWAEELQERGQVASTLMDDIDTNEIWHRDGSVTILERERQSA